MFPASVFRSHSLAKSGLLISYFRKFVALFYFMTLHMFSAKVVMSFKRTKAPGHLIFFYSTRSSLFFEFTILAKFCLPSRSPKPFMLRSEYH